MAAPHSSLTKQASLLPQGEMRKVATIIFDYGEMAEWLKATDC